MVPEAQDGPASAAEEPIGIPISPHIAFDFCSPPCSVSLWPSSVGRASMPEAAVDKDCHFLSEEGHVRAAVGAR